MNSEVKEMENNAGGSEQPGSVSGTGAVSTSGNDQSGSGVNTSGNAKGNSQRSKTNRGGLEGNGQQNDSSLRSNGSSSGTGDPTVTGSAAAGTAAGGNSGAAVGSEPAAKEKRIYEKSPVLKPNDVKPSKAKSGKAAKETKNSGSLTDSDMIGTLIQTGGILISGLTGRDHWRFTDDEAMTIANPAAAMLSTLTTAQKKKIEKFTAPAMLAAAVASVCIPKILIDLTMLKEARTNGNRTAKPSYSIQPGGNESTRAQQPTRREEPAVDSKANSANVDPSISGLFSTDN